MQRSVALVIATRTIRAIRGEAMDGRRGRRCRGLAALTFAVVGLGLALPAAAREREDLEAARAA